MSLGWTGNILRVDLTHRKSWLEETEPYTSLFIGGKGINVKILYDEVDPDVAPYGPENKICLGPGVLAGTMAPSHTRMKITSISPNGHLQNSGIGGHIPAQIRNAGYDNVVIQGSSSELVYLHIDDDKIEIRDAAHLRGKDIMETQRILKDELGDRFSVACIGLAGENAVSIGCIVTGQGSAAGRGGFGAIMGSKNLKAIAVRGSRNAKLAHPLEFAEACRDMHLWLENFGGALTEQSKGGVGDREILDTLYEGGMPVLGNWEVEDATWEQMGGRFPDPEPFYRESAALQYGCMGCPVHHMFVFDVPGRCKGTTKCVQWDAFSSRVWNSDREIMVHANVLCQNYGMDSIGASGAVSFLMELYHRGIISEEDTDGVPMRRGDETAIMTVIEKIARQEGFGKLFKDGVWGAAREIGVDAEECAVVVDRQDMEPTDPRSAKGWGLVAAVTDGTVAHGHVIDELGWSVGGREELEKTGQELFGSKDAFNPVSYEAKAKTVWDEENLNTAGDLLGTCKWIIPWSVSRKFDVPAKLFSLATGRETSGDEIVLAAQRTLTLERASKVRHGKRRDTLPNRMFETAVPDGLYKGERLDRAKFDAMLDEYYALRGWDDEGVPTRETFEKFGLNAEFQALSRALQSE
jgi:aldehyde:ferredoxin oxidoreductase